MKTRLVLMIACFSSLFSCSSTEERVGNIDVEDRDSTVVAETGKILEGAQVYGVGAEMESVLDPLNDPSSQLSVRTIYFAYDSASVRPEFRPIIESHAEYLAMHPDITVTLEGHADERGSREYNLALGENRASAVKRQMLLLGTSAEQIRIVSYGEERPVVEGHDESAWSKNRRVIIIY